MRKMKRAGQRILSVLTMTALLLGASGFTSMAAEIDIPGNFTEEGGEVEVLEATVVDNEDLSSEISPYTMLSSCMISVGEESDGMHIGISTGTSGTASVLGVKDIKIWKKNSKGNWDLVAISSGGEATNRAIVSVNIVYANAVKYATYKITCVHYGNVDGYVEGANDSGEFVYDFK